MGLLQEISSENDLTVIASLHQVQLAIDFADRIIGLRSGRLVLDRTTENLHADEASQIYTSVSGLDLDDHTPEHDHEHKHGQSGPRPADQHASASAGDAA
jgi:phosphonate transport system ATP-binding protein